MSQKTTLTILYISAIINAVLINIQLLQITHLNWWFVLSPTWFVVIMTLKKVVTASVKNAVQVFHPITHFAYLKVWVLTNHYFKK